MKQMLTSLHHALKEKGFELTDTNLKEKQEDGSYKRVHRFEVKDVSSIAHLTIYLNDIKSAVERVEFDQAQAEILSLDDRRGAFRELTALAIVSKYMKGQTSLF